MEKRSMRMVRKVSDEQSGKMALLEAVLFTTSEPLGFNELQKVMKCRKQELEKLLEKLRSRYESDEHGIQLSDMGGYQLVTKPQFMEHVSNLTPHADLSRGLLRVLSIIAYHQPIKQSDIVKVVGNRTYDYVKELETRGLVKSERKARTKFLSTTPRFDEYFGAQAEMIKKGKMPEVQSENQDQKKEEISEEKKEGSETVKEEPSQEKGREETDQSVPDNQYLK